MSYYIPAIIRETSEGTARIPIADMMFQRREVWLTGEITSEVADAVISQILHLDAEDPDAEITMYIDSPGGSVTAGMAIYDTMNFVKCDVSTICIGMAASMGAFLLSAGAKGKRSALPNAEIMIHQPSGGARGQASDMKIHTDWIIRTREKLNRIMAEQTGQPIEVIERDTERDNFMTAQQAMEYGLVDKIIAHRE